MGCHFLLQGIFQTQGSNLGLPHSRQTLQPLSHQGSPFSGYRTTLEPLFKQSSILWHHRRNGHEFEQAPGDGEGQGSLVCCSPWGCKESDTTEWLNINNSIPQQCLFVFSMVLFGGNFVFWLISDLWKSYISCIRNSSHNFFQIH